MDIFDEEREIISFFQSLEYKEVAFFPFIDDKSEAIFLSLHSEELWEKWVDSSAHNAPPPDFYNNEMQVMMDVMRVDDHGYKNKKGKIVNPARQHDTELMRELGNLGILKQFPNAKLLVNGITDLPTKEDHNYTYYYKNFCRTVNLHKEKIPNYKMNHPGFSVVFFVFDESSMYCSTTELYLNRKVGDTMKGVPHLWFTDKRCIDVLIDSEIDYLIWFTPYKYANIYDTNVTPLSLPHAVIINSHRLDEIYLNDYPIDTMESIEL